MKNWCLTPFFWFLLATPAFAATSEFKVELPAELRKMAGRGTLSPVTHAAVTIATTALRFISTPGWATRSRPGPP